METETPNYLILLVLIFIMLLMPTCKDSKETNEKLGKIIELLEKR